MASLAPEARNHFLRDLRLSQEAVRRGVVPGTQRKADGHWQQWETFCQEHNLDPLLEHYRDPVPILQVFATRYRRRTGPAGLPVRSSTVSDALRSVGQTMASMGSRDPRKDATGEVDFRLSRQFRAYAREDPPPNRVKPIPISLIRHIANQAREGHAAEASIADMIILGFFFLLRPGEYTGSNNDDTPFRLNDVQLFIGNQRMPHNDHRLHTATSVSLTFTTQKNGVRGEVVNHGTSGHPWLCPVQAAARRISRLVAHQVPPDTVLASYFTGHRHRLVITTNITTTLRHAAVIMGPPYGYLPADVSARSLRAGGATALFNSKVDSDTI